MIRPLVYFFTGSSLFAHMFCCILPLFFNILALLSGVGLTTGFSLPAHTIEWFHHYELGFFIFSSLISIFALILHFLQKKIQNVQTCCQKSTQSRKNSHRIFPILILFMLFFESRFYII